MYNKAILDGRKTVTRRAVKPQPIDTIYQMIDVGTGRKYKPPYRPGDILYVKETWTPWPEMRRAGVTGHLERFYYKADGNTPNGVRWHPSIHMPREAARIFLRVTDVRVDRLKILKIWEAVEEGVVKRLHYTKRGDLVLHEEYRKKFAELWDSTIKPADRALYGWKANPWVWVIEFERISNEEANGQCQTG